MLASGKVPAKLTLSLAAVTVAVIVPSMAGGAPITPRAAATQAHILPNGRQITPAGTIVTANDFPAGLALGKDGPLFVSGAGEGRNSLGAVDRVTLRGAYVFPVVEEEFAAVDPTSQSGSLALSPDGKTLFAAGAGRGDVISFTATNPPVQQSSYRLPDGQYAGGVAASPDGQYLFVTEPLDTTKQPYARGTKLTRLSLHGGAPVTMRVGTHPMPVAAALVPGQGLRVAVGNEGDGTVSIVDGKGMRIVATVPIGRHPSNLVFTKDGSALLVIGSLDDELTEISTRGWRRTTRLSLRSPAGIGAQPDGIAVAPNGADIYVALAQDNTIAVVRRRASRLALTGLIPTAAWPTAVAFDPSGPAILVAAGKGVGLDFFTPPGLDPDDVPIADQQTGRGTSGVIERIPVPKPSQLAAYSKAVDRNNGWSAPAPPQRSCGPTEIKHIVLIVRENKTYDQELGDASAGGDPSRVMYGRNITPNTHAIAERFGLLTAFYANEEISDTGHQALASGLVSDWDERFMLQLYGAHSPVEYAEYAADAEGEGYNVDGIQWGPSDYLVDSAWRHGLEFKVFGHAFRHSQTDPAHAIDPRLDAHIMRKMPGFGWDLEVPDQVRAAFWVKTFEKDVATGRFPAFEVIYLPNDHTGNQVPGLDTPMEEVADNDVATGMIVDALSHSKYWGSSAVFMEEDDPQSGTDHVDAHRSVAFVASPWTKRNHVSKVHHDQASILRTIELLLELPPLTEIDATATPLFEIWSDKPDLRPYDTLTPDVPTGREVVAANAAAARYAAQVTARHPEWRGVDRMPPELQLDIQWMGTHGGKHFDPSVFDPPIGSAAAGERFVRVGPAGPGICGKTPRR